MASRVIPMPVKTDEDVQRFIQNLPITPWTASGTLVRDHTGTTVAVVEERNAALFLAVPDLAARLGALTRYIEELEDYVSELRDELDDVREEPSHIDEGEEVVSLKYRIERMARYAAKTLDKPVPQKPA